MKNEEARVTSLFSMDSALRFDRAYAALRHSAALCTLRARLQRGKAASVLSETEAKRQWVKAL